MSPSTTPSPGATLSGLIATELNHIVDLLPAVHQVERFADRVKQETEEDLALLEKFAPPGVVVRMADHRVHLRVLDGGRVA